MKRPVKRCNPWGFTKGKQGLTSEYCYSCGDLKASHPTKFCVQSYGNQSLAVDKPKELPSSEQEIIEVFESYILPTANVRLSECLVDTQQGAWIAPWFKGMSYGDDFYARALAGYTEGLEDWRVITRVAGKHASPPFRTFRFPRDQKDWDAEQQEYVYLGTYNDLSKSTMGTYYVMVSPDMVQMEMRYRDDMRFSWMTRPVLDAAGYTGDCLICVKTIGNRDVMVKRNPISAGSFQRLKANSITNVIYAQVLNTGLRGCVVWRHWNDQNTQCINCWKPNPDQLGSNDYVEWEGAVSDDPLKDLYGGKMSNQDLEDLMAFSGYDRKEIKRFNESDNVMDRARLYHLYFQLLGPPKVSSTYSFPTFMELRLKWPNALG